MSFEIGLKSLWDARRSLLGWSLGIAGAAAIYTSSYALIEPTAYQDVIEGFPPDLLEAFGWEDIASPAGYLGSTVFGLVVPILTVIFAIAMGTRFLAGDEEAGTLELTLTHPVSRRSIALQRAASAALSGLGAALVVAIAVLALAGPVGLDVETPRVLAASLSLGLLAIAFSMLAVAIGAFVGRRGVVLGTCAAVAVIAYFSSTLLPTLEGLEWTEKTSLFFYYGGQTILEEGFSPGNALVLALVSLALLTAAVFGFERRDIGVG